MTTTDSADLKDRLAEQAEGTNGGGNLPERAKASPATLVRHAIERQTAAFEAVLPDDFDAERFGRLVLSAVKATPELMQCFGTRQGETSVLLAAMQAAAIGLEPNTPTQECWLLPRKNKGVWECQLSIGYRGYLKLARRSGEIKTVFAEVVRHKDHFRWERGLEEDVLEHRPYDGDDDPGDLTHVYAVVRYRSGGYNFMVLNRRDVEKRRAMSDSFKSETGRKYSPWVKWEPEMWRKSGVRALVPYMELSTRDARAVMSDERALRYNADEQIIEADETSASALEALDAAGMLGAGPQEDEQPEPDDDGPDDDGGGGGKDAPASDDEAPQEPVEATATEEAPSASGAPKAPSRRKAGDGDQGEQQPLGDITRARLLRGIHALAREVWPDDGDRDDRRHALIGKVTRGATRSLTRCDVEQLIRVRAWLEDVRDGRIEVEADSLGRWQVIVHSAEGAA